MKGGVGKTTLAINIADYISRREQKKILLIDIDPQFNATQCLFSAEAYIEHLSSGKDTILNIFDNEVRRKASTVSGSKKISSRVLSDIRPVKITDYLHILPGNLELFKIEMSSGSGKENKLKFYIEDINKIENYDYVLIDTPPTPSVWMTSALIASEYYIIPVKPDPLSLVGIDLLENIVDQKREAYNLNIKCIGIIFTMVERSDSIIYRDALRNLKSDTKWADYPFKKYLPKRATIARKQLEKQFILDTIDSSAKSSLAAIVKELNERLS